VDEEVLVKKRVVSAAGSRAHGKQGGETYFLSEKTGPKKKITYSSSKGGKALDS